MKFNPKYTTEEKAYLKDVLMTNLPMNYVGNNNETQEHFDARCDAILTRKRTEDAKKAERQAKKDAREKAKADAMGLTVEEYRAKVKHQKKVEALEVEIAELEETLARKRAYLAKLKK